MSDWQTHIIKRLRATGAATIEFFRSFAADSFQQQIYSSGGEWLLRDVLAHFVSIEHTFLNYGREETIVLVESMKDNDLDREGRHPYFGFLALEKMLKLIYRHNMIHERDIRRAFHTGAPADAA